MSDTRNIEEKFYSLYSWCLNPPLTIKDLLRRFEEEIDRHETLDGWQREESKANLYLFACAIACTADDYLASRWLNLTPLYSRLPRFHRLLSAISWLLDVLQSGIRIGDRRVRVWRLEWNKCLEYVCGVLASDTAASLEAFRKLHAASGEFLRAPLPDALLIRRMRLPEAFRSQDMAHQDVIALIERFCSSVEPDGAPVVIMGLRTAGAYFAPLMCEYLRAKKWRQVSWFSIRPKNGTTRWEERQIRQAVSRRARLLVVDDYASSGRTIRMTLQILRRLGVEPGQIAIVAPTHPAQTKWVQLAGIDKTIPVFTIHEEDLHKTEFLASPAVESLCAEYFAPEGWSAARVLKDGQVDLINAGLAQHSQDGHQVREKRVFAVELSGAGRPPEVKKVFFKSVGWGWLGYHAYIAGKRLEGFVPGVLGLRGGLLLTEWVDRNATDAGALEGSRMVPVLASYVAARCRRLTLTDNCRFENRTYRWTGSDEIVNILRSAYGPFMNRLKRPALRKRLHEYVAAVPTLVDGRMRPEEWIPTSTGVYKVDFEHHNFGGGELDIVDPAYDLAAAMFEFRLSKPLQTELLQAYAKESGDTSIAERILIYKILYGVVAMKGAAYNIARGRTPAKSNERCQFARDFLVYSMNDFCSELIKPRNPPVWADSLFFMDLDGVFDQEILGFPHATLSGLQSLALLHSHGLSVVLNTGRGVRHVRQYCEAYGLSGGIAEFGGVFIDSVRHREIPLIDSMGAEQLDRFREVLRAVPGVFIDPGYVYSIRAYRYKGALTVGLDLDELKSLLRSSEFSRLTFIDRGPDTYIVQKRTSKAAGLKFVRRSVGRPGIPVTAIGDSRHDIGMLKAAEFAYAPSNCHPLLRQMGKRGECTILNQRYQNGLLAAVQHRLRHGPVLPSTAPATPGHMPASVNTLMQTVLKAADRRMAFQVLVALSWWSL